MTTGLSGIRRRLRRGKQPTNELPAPLPAEPRADASDVVPFDIAPNDPIVPYFQGATGAVDVDLLEIDSPARDALREAGVKLVVPLVSQGELIGLLNLGPRLSEQDYSPDDRKLLENLAAQAAPALQVARLVREQEAEAVDRERIAQELRVAQLIQQNFLPKTLPDLPGWQVNAYYRPAREVGGDFYDFIELPNGSVGIVVGDVTDKGVPAAMVMSATRSLLRASGQRLTSPGEVLARVNEVLCPDMPPKMFVTCLYAVLEPATGRLRYANAGHNLPYVRTDEGVIELRARGMPLGLMLDMEYEEMEATLEPGQAMLLHSDGVAEAHDPDRDMFGFPRLMGLVGGHRHAHEMIDRVLSALDSFTGPDWEQEDDITLVSLERSSGASYAAQADSGDTASTVAAGNGDGEGGSRTLAEFDLPSEQGNERLAIERVSASVKDLELEPARLERLKTAVGEATMNAMEHGNEYRADSPVSLQVLSAGGDLRVRITDHGGGRDIPDAETPDIEAKLAGLQKPRGWGLFLIKEMVDEMEVTTDARHHTVELTLHLEGDRDASKSG